MKVKRFFSLCLLFVFLFHFDVYAHVNAVESSKNSSSNCFDLQYPCKSYLLADEVSGKILVESNADEKLPIASITKIMLLIIGAEKIERENLSLKDEKVVTSAYAKSMEGSKVYLEEGESMSLDDIIKAVGLMSGNDAAVAFAEYIAGSEEECVALMNKKAQQLGMTNTHFSNVCGLHADDHYSSARDVAIMARELLTRHPWIKKYTSVYEARIRDNEAVRYNTNKLVKFYKGCTGLKTGHTDEAGYCLCASATRGSDENNDKMSLISVCLGVPNSLGRDEGDRARAENCAYLLDYGFSSFKVLDAKVDEKELAPVEVLKGQEQFVSIGLDEKSVPILIKKSSASDVTKTIEIKNNITAPVEKGQVVGSVVYSIDKQEIARQNLIAKKDVKKANFWFLFKSIVGNFFAGVNVR